MTDHQTLRDLRPYMRRLWNPVTRNYLHLSGSGETQGTAHAWAGTRDQARSLRDRAKTRNQHFPYVLTSLQPARVMANDAEHI